MREPVWTSGKALGWYAEGPRFSLLFKKVLVCGHCLVTLSFTVNETLKWLSSLHTYNAGVILVVNV